METLDSQGSDDAVGEETLAGTLAGTLAPGASSQSWQALEPGQRLGRYVLLRTLGHGSMGQVYAAYDSELDRHVALKVLRRGGDTERLRNEAQAMARLVHPNVVTVFDHLVVDERSIIAMELVAGTTLREWLSGHKRTPTEIVSVFIAAGRGLAAAHRVGLVHRDFKPANVLLSNPEDAAVRVLVADFGLVAVGDAQSDADHFGGSLPLAGTPRYMAPEQFSGEGVDARADQWAFCVALYEALFGTPPFVGANVAEVAAAVIDGSRPPMPRRPGVRAAVLAAIDRGLSKDPNARFASLDELLERIAPTPSRARRVAAGTALFAAGAAAIWVSPEKPAIAGCSDEDAFVWNEDDRAAAQTTFAALGAELTVPWETLDTTAGAYIERAEAQRQRACAANVTGTLGVRPLRARLQCLEDAAIPLLETVKLWPDADLALAASAPAHVAARPPLSRCADIVGSVDRRVELDPEARLRLVRARAQANTLTQLGRDEEALAVVEAVLPDDPPVHGSTADLLVTRGHIREALHDEKGALEDFWRAAAIGISAGEPVHTANALAWIVLAEGNKGRPELAMSIAELSLSLTPGNDWVRHRVLNHVGYMAMENGDLEAAERAWTDAAEAAGRIDDLAPEAAAMLQANLAVLAARRGDLAEALEGFSRVAQAQRSLYGAQSIHRASALTNALRAAHRLGESERAEALEEEIAGILRTNATKSPEEVAYGYRALADLSAKSGDRVKLLEDSARAVEVLRAAEIEVSENRTRALRLIAMTHIELGDLDAAGEAVRGAFASCPSTAMGDRVATHVVAAELSGRRGDARGVERDLDAAQDLLGGVEGNRGFMASLVRAKRARTALLAGRAIFALTELHRARELEGAAARVVTANEQVVEAMLLLRVGDPATAYQVANAAAAAAELDDSLRRETLCEARQVLAQASRTHKGSRLAEPAVAAATACCEGTKPPMSSCLAALRVDAANDEPSVSP